MTAAGCGTVKIYPPQHSIKQREKCGLVAGLIGPGIHAFAPRIGSADARRPRCSFGGRGVISVQIPDGVGTTTMLDRASLDRLASASGRSV
jgi:hypothetical protein